MNLLKILSLFVAGVLLLAACSSSRDLPTVRQVDLSEYAGTWYDIAHLPQSFQDNCKCVTADYRVKDDHVKVINTCIDKQTEEVSQVTGKAYPVENSNNSKLEVEIIWPFDGEYYIIALEDNYSYAMVGSPDRESLWILSRRPEPAAIILKEYLNKAEELGFDTSKMVYTDQSCHVKPIEESS